MAVNKIILDDINKIDNLSILSNTKLLGVLNTVIKNEKNLYAQLIEIVDFLNTTYFGESNSDNFITRPINGKVSSVSITNGKLIVSYYYEGAIHNVIYRLDIEDSQHVDPEPIDPDVDPTPVPGYDTKPGSKVTILTQFISEGDLSILQPGEVGDYAYADGTIYVWKNDAWTEVTDAYGLYLYNNNIYKYDEGVMTVVLEGADKTPIITTLTRWENYMNNLVLQGNTVGDYAYIVNGVYTWNGTAWVTPTNYNYPLYYVWNNDLYELYESNKIKVVIKGDTKEVYHCIKFGGSAPSQVTNGAYIMTSDNHDDDYVGDNCKIYKGENGSWAIVGNPTQNTTYIDCENKIIYYWNGTEFKTIGNYGSGGGTIEVDTNFSPTSNKPLANSFLTAQFLDLVGKVNTNTNNISNLDEAIKELNIEETVINNLESNETNPKVNYNIEQTLSAIVPIATVANRNLTTRNIVGNVSATTFSDSNVQYRIIGPTTIRENITVGSGSVLSFTKAGSFINDTSETIKIDAQSPIRAIVEIEHQISTPNIVWTSNIVLDGATPEMFGAKGLKEDYYNYPLVNYNTTIDSSDEDLFYIQKAPSADIAECPSEDFIHNGYYAEYIRSGNTNYRSIAHKNYIVYSVEHNCFLLNCGYGVYYAYWEGSDFWNDGDTELRTKPVAKTSLRNKVLAIQDVDGSLACIKRVIPASEPIYIQKDTITTTDVSVLIKKPNSSTTKTITIAAGATVLYRADYTATISSKSTAPTIRPCVIYYDISWAVNYWIWLEVAQGSPVEQNAYSVSSTVLNNIPRLLTTKTQYGNEYYNKTGNLGKYKTNFYYTANDVYYDANKNRFYLLDEFNVTVDNKRILYEFWGNSDCWNEVIYNTITNESTVKAKEKTLFCNLECALLHAGEYNDPVNKPGVRVPKICIGNNLVSLESVLQEYYGNTTYDWIPIRNVMRTCVNGTRVANLGNNKKYVTRSGLNVLTVNDVTGLELDQPAYIDIACFDGHNSTIFGFRQYAYDASDRETFVRSNYYAATGTLVPYGYFAPKSGNAEYMVSGKSYLFIKCSTPNVIYKNFTLQFINDKRAIGPGTPNNYYNRWGAEWYMSHASSNIWAFSIEADNVILQSVTIKNALMPVQIKTYAGSDYDKFTMDNVKIIDGDMCFVPRQAHYIDIYNSYIKQKDYIGGNGSHIVYGQDSKVRQILFENCTIETGYYANTQTINFHNSGNSGVVIKFNKCNIIGNPDIGSAKFARLDFSSCKFDLWYKPVLVAIGRLKAVEGVFDLGYSWNTTIRNCIINTELPLITSYDGTNLSTQRNLYRLLFEGNTVNADLSNITTSDTFAAVVEAKPFLIKYFGQAVFKNNTINIKEGNFLFPVGSIRLYMLDNYISAHSVGVNFPNGIGGIFTVKRNTFIANKETVTSGKYNFLIYAVSPSEISASSEIVDNFITSVNNLKNIPEGTWTLAHQNSDPEPADYDLLMRVVGQASLLTKIVIGINNRLIGLVNREYTDGGVTKTEKYFVAKVLDEARTINKRLEAVESELES